MNSSKEMKFLVGFFYFSGISELYNTFKQKDKDGKDFTLKILVGLKVDKIVSNNLTIEFARNEKIVLERWRIIFLNLPC